MTDALLDCFPPYCLRLGSSSILELTDSARLVSELAPETCQSLLPQHRDYRDANTLVGLLMLLLRFELRSLRSHGKNLTDSAISSASASHILTPNDH